MQQKIIIKGLISGAVTELHYYNELYLHSLFENYYFLFGPIGTGVLVYAILTNNLDSKLQFKKFYLVLSELQRFVNPPI